MLVSRIPYFAALLGGEFSDSHRLSSTAAASEAEATGSAAVCFEVSIDGLLQDGISLQSFLEVIQFAYTGESPLLSRLAQRQAQASQNTAPTSCETILDRIRHSEVKYAFISVQRRRPAMGWG